MDHLKDLLTFPDRLREMLGLLELNKRRLAEDMNAPLAQSGGYNPKHAQAASSLSRAMKDLGTEMRAWIDKVETKTDSIPQKTKIELLCRFIVALPVGTRKKIYDVFVTNEAKWPQGVKLFIEEQEKEETNDTEAQPEGCDPDSGDVAGDVPDVEVCGSDPEQHVRDGDERSDPPTFRSGCVSTGGRE